MDKYGNIIFTPDIYESITTIRLYLDKLDIKWLAYLENWITIGVIKLLKRDKWLIQKRGVIDMGGKVENSIAVKNEELEYPTSLYIKSVEISKFRSLKKIKCDFSKLQVFVGCNDSGKSNILKALNLFFNNEVGNKEVLDFKKDFNFDGHINRKADEISIKLTFRLPYTYWDNNGQYLVWEKRWRNGKTYDYEKEEDYFYGLNEKNEKIEIKSKSNVRTLMSRINYIYVPAIRDKNYFDQLRATIYKTMTKVAQSSMEKASQSFEEQMKKPLEDLVKDTEAKLGENVIMSFPKNLSNIFEKLDFLAGEYKVSLDERGDGIKSRYIPLIWNFIAANERKMTGKGAAPFTFIWGYEEPENNMEISACVKLKEQLIDYINCGTVSQILLTTHSPVFYNLKNEKKLEIFPSVLHVQKNSNKETCLNSDREAIDKAIGVVELLAPYYEKEEERIRIIEENEKEARALLSNAQKPILFVEGDTDKMVYSRLFDVFSIPHNFNIVNEGYGSGSNYVADNIEAWVKVQKFKQSYIRAAGIVDEDAKEKARNCNAENIKIARCFVVPQSDRCTQLLKSKEYKILLNADLESFYPEEVWEGAETKGWLIQKKTTEILRSDIMLKCINDEEDKEELLKDLPLWVTHKIAPHKKRNFANLVLSYNNDELKSMFCTDIESFLKDISNYLTEDVTV